MHPRLVGLALGMASAAYAQSAGAKAVVTKDALPVYPKMTASSEPAALLDKGARVTIGLVLFGDDVTWCAVSKEGDTRRLGFVSCEFLEPDRSPPPAAPVAPPPEPPKPPAAPARVRDVPRPAMKVTELKPLPVPEAPKSAPPEPEPPKPDPPRMNKLEPAAVPAPLPDLPKPEPAHREPPPAVPSHPPLTAPQILDRSGAASQIAMYVRATNFLSYLDKGRLAAIDSGAVRSVIAKHFQVSAYHRAIASRLAAGQPAELPNWLEQPQTAKLAEMTKIASTAAAREELVAYASGLRADPPAQERLLLIHRLHDATRSTGLELESTIAVVRAIAEAINPALPADKRFQRADLDQALAGVRSTLEPILKNARIVHYLFTFRAAADDELEQYVRFWESPSGQWLRAAVEAGFSDATRQMGVRFRAEIPSRLKTP